MATTGCGLLHRNFLRAQAEVACLGTSQQEIQSYCLETGPWSQQLIKQLLMDKTRGLQDSRENALINQRAAEAPNRGGGGRRAEASRWDLGNFPRSRLKMLSGGSILWRQEFLKVAVPAVPGRRGKGL